MSTEAPFVLLKRTEWVKTKRPDNMPSSAYVEKHYIEHEDDYEAYPFGVLVAKDLTCEEAIALMKMLPAKEVEASFQSTLGFTDPRTMWDSKGNLNIGTHSQTNPFTQAQQSNPYGQMQQTYLNDPGLIDSISRLVSKLWKK